MSNDLLGDVTEFHVKFGLMPDGPRALSHLDDLNRFRIKFMDEELQEFKEESVRLTFAIELGARQAGRAAIAGQLDAMVDSVYVTLGTVVMMGLADEFRQAWQLVHEANMKKVRAERAEQSRRGSSFDVIKPEGWVAPDLEPLVPSSMLDAIFGVDKKDGLE